MRVSLMVVSLTLQCHPCKQLKTLKIASWSLGAPQVAPGVTVHRLDTRPADFGDTLVTRLTVTLFTRFWRTPDTCTCHRRTDSSGVL
jgi:hypothetical protein